MNAGLIEGQVCRRPAQPPDGLLSFHISGLHPQYGVLRQGFAFIGFCCADVERRNAPPAGTGQADGDDTLGIRIRAHGFEGGLGGRDIVLLAEGVVFDVDGMVEVFDFDLSERNGFAVGKHYGAEHAACPVGIGFVQGLDFHRRALRFRPVAGYATHIDDQLGELLDVDVFLSFQVGLGFEYEDMVT